MANKFVDQNGLRHFFSKIKAMLGLKANVSDLKPVATSGSYNDLTDKTHWAEVGGSGSTTIILEEQSIEVDGDGVYGNDTVLSDYALGDMVNVDWDGTPYVCEIKSFSEGGLTALYCGSEISFNEDYAGNEPFTIFFNCKPGDGTEGWGVISIDQNSGTHTIKVYKGGAVTIYHKLPNDYLNLEFGAIDGSKNPITSGAVYNVKQELNNDMVRKDGLDTNINEYVTDGNAPSSKAVYTAMANAKNTLCNTLIVNVTGFNEDYSMSNTSLSADKTYDELVSEYLAGKYIIVKNNLGDLFTLYNYESRTGFANAFTFVNAYNAKGNAGTNYLFCKQIGVTWVYNSANTFVDDNYIISESSTVTEVPNAKCVYDAIENVKSTIPSVSDWAKQSTKPTYTASEVGADASGTAASAVSSHNTNTSAHNDMRLLIKDIADRLNALADSDDTTLDQMSEIVAYIKNNKSLIDNITTSKVSIADIINNLTTNVTDKPLSAAQGVALKALIDAITVPTALSQLSSDATHRTVTDEEKAAWNGKSNFSGSYNDLSNKPNIVIGDKAYKIVVSSTAPTVDDRSVITLVTG